MKISFILLLVLGLAYLFILEDVGNFISLNLDKFKQELLEQKHAREEKQDTTRNPSWILRTPTDLLLEQQRDKFTDDEKQYIKEQIAMFETISNQTLNEGLFNKIDAQMLVQDNFYKRLVYDAIQKRNSNQA
ncbi:UNKNOWN [Stylonychia lemnae]|uniref:Uncharacterized protein n=1 Tax=Stylonychia lemnae TaxID=5949 RepID=A0A078AW20_STYLE|nr:UNKNOWN [Stylonychia lemnae]|eukprot:CDW84978.1 UNKNOWN [Stylonychia lemnae]